MRRRIFVAINLPENTKQTLGDLRQKWPELPARWTNPQNLHITLAFLGYLQDEELVDALKIAKETSGNHPSFPVKLSRVCYGPPGKMPPRMVWAMGDSSEEFSALKDYLDKSFSESAQVRNIREKRESRAHITLARIKQWEFRRIEPEERPTIDEDIDLSFPVGSIEVMESRLKKGGPEYDVIESMSLGQ